MIRQKASEAVPQTEGCHAQSRRSRRCRAESSALGMQTSAPKRLHLKVEAKLDSGVRIPVPQGT